MNSRIFFIVILAVMFMNFAAPAFGQSLPENEKTSAENAEKIYRLEKEISTLRARIGDYVHDRYEVEKLYDLVQMDMATEESLLEGRLGLVVLEKELGALTDAGIKEAERILLALEQKTDIRLERKQISEHEARENLIENLLTRIELGILPDRSRIELKSAVEEELKRLNDLKKNQYISKRDYESKKQQLENMLKK